VSSHNLVLSCLFIVRVVSGLISAEADRDSWNSADSTYLGKVRGCIVKVFNFTMLSHLLFLCLFATISRILFLVRISRAQNVRVLRDVWNTRDRVKISLLSLFLNIRPFIDVRFLTIMYGCMNLMILVIKVQIVVFKLWCFSNISKR
jgi:hypothetical protein